MKKKVLVTGSSGFIGFHIANKLLKNNFEVYGIDNHNKYYDTKLKLLRNKISINNGLKFTLLDISNFTKLNNFLSKIKFDYVIHLAGQAGVRASFKKSNDYFKSNILGTYNLAESLKNKKLKHFIFSSTSSVYGKRNSNKAFKESDIAKEPLSFYATSKLCCENILFNSATNYNIPITTLRFFTVYGPLGRPDMALYKFIDSASKNKSIDVYNNGQLWRDFTYIDDIVNSIHKLLKISPSEKNRVSNDSLSKIAPYRVVNIGNQSSIKLDDFITKIEKITNLKFIRNNKPMQSGDMYFTLSDSSLLKKLTGYQPKTKIENGINNFYKWYVNHNL